MTLKSNYLLTNYSYDEDVLFFERRGRGLDRENALSLIKRGQVEGDEGDVRMTMTVMT